MDHLFILENIQIILIEFDTYVSDAEVATILGVQKTWFAAASIILVLILAGLLISAISYYCHRQVTNPRHSHSVLNSRTYPPISFPCKL